MYFDMLLSATNNTGCGNLSNKTRYYYNPSVAGDDRKMSHPLTLTHETPPRCLWSGAKMTPTLGSFRVKSPNGF